MLVNLNEVAALVDARNSQKVGGCLLRVHFALTMHRLFLRKSNDIFLALDETKKATPPTFHVFPHKKAAVTAAFL